jgi:hypothetical protein
MPTGAAGGTHDTDDVAEEAALAQPNYGTRLNDDRSIERELIRDKKALNDVICTLSRKVRALEDALDEERRCRVRVESVIYFLTGLL